jgi:hypothetical protein
MMRRPRLSRRLTAALLVLAVIGCVGNGAPSVARAAPPESKLQLHVVDAIEFVIDHELSRERLEELAGHMRDVERQMQDELGVPPLEKTVRVYLFATHAAFSNYVRQHIPSVGRTDAAVRHGVFLLRQERPFVFLASNDDLVQSLRHETVHVVLNTSHPALPIWIDEGLAQCYENPDGSHHSERAERVLKNDLLRRGAPKAQSLEKLRTMSQLGPREYAGCWANLEALLASPSGRTTLSDYLANLREGKSATSLSHSTTPLDKRVR